jgi:hypothetical protein
MLENSSLKAVLVGVARKKAWLSMSHNVDLSPSYIPNSRDVDIASC